jgi:hypothetical protein
MIQIQNLSNIVDKYLFQVEGLDESWYKRSTSEIALMPQATEQAQITFLPPNKRGSSQVFISLQLPSAPRVQRRKSTDHANQRVINVCVGPGRCPLRHV